jgi:hypothetical protein
VGRGELAIVSSDNAPPYERLPLSQGFLAGTEAEESVFINPPSFYEEHGIELCLTTVVTGGNPRSHRGPRGRRARSGRGGASNLSLRLQARRLRRRPAATA